MESTLWAIAIKGDRSGSDIKTACAEFGDVKPFRIPAAQLRIGTLDSLMSLSDDLTKMEMLAEQTVTKMFKQLTDLKPDEEPTIHSVPVVPYTTMQWEWDEAKLQLKTPLRELCENISLRVSSLDDELKLKLGEVNVLKGSLQTIERKTQGNLMVRGLADLVREEDVMESEYMTTVFVVVPKMGMKEFETGYEKMATYVVPKSGRLLSEDTEYGLFKVVIFKKSIDEFKASAREKRLTMREFTYTPGVVAEEQAKKMKDEIEMDKLKVMLTNWCQINYAESYVMLLHLKAVRVFVESVLRYGLTATYAQGMVPNFKAFFIQPKKGKAEALRKALGALFVGASGAMAEGEEESVVPGATGEFFPYVYTAIETEPVANV